MSTTLNLLLRILSSIVYGGAWQAGPNTPCVRSTVCMHGLGDQCSESQIETIFHQLVQWLNEPLDAGGFIQNGAFDSSISRECIFGCRERIKYSSRNFQFIGHLRGNGSLNVGLHRGFSLGPSSFCLPRKTSLRDSSSLTDAAAALLHRCFRLRLCFALRL